MQIMSNLTFRQGTKFRLKSEWIEGLEYSDILHNRVVGTLHSLKQG